MLREIRFIEKKAGKLTPTHNTGAKADGLEGKPGKLTPAHNTGAKADGLEGKPLLRPCHGWLEHCTESETSSSDALAVPGTSLRCPGRRHA